MEYYFAGWEEDSSDIFELMEEWWEDTPLASEKCNIDREAFKQLHFSGSLLCICSRNEEGKLIACFVGALVPDIYRKGDKKLEQLAACFSKEYRTPLNYKEMVRTVESICKKLGISRLNISTSERMARILEKKSGYKKDSMLLMKEINYG